MRLSHLEAGKGVSNRDSGLIIEEMDHEDEEEESKSPNVLNIHQIRSSSHEAISSLDAENLIQSSNQLAYEAGGDGTKI